MTIAYCNDEMRSMVDLEKGTVDRRIFSDQDIYELERTPSFGPTVLGPTGWLPRVGQSSRPTTRRRRKGASKVYYLLPDFAFTVSNAHRSMGARGASLHSETEARPARMTPSLGIFQGKALLFKYRFVVPECGFHPARLTRRHVYNL